MKRVDKLLDEVTNLLLSDLSDAKRGSYSVDMRKLELLKLGNSMRGEGLLRWMEADETDEEVEAEQTEEPAD
jgi:hypothetical protein